jgi:hypothetical protein
MVMMICHHLRIVLGRTNIQIQSSTLNEMGGFGLSNLMLAVILASGSSDIVGRGEWSINR